MKELSLEYIEQTIKEMLPDFGGVKDEGNGWFSISSPKRNGERGLKLYTRQAGLDMFNKALKEEAERYLAG
mgnify:CR=1 FL=1